MTTATVNENVKYKRVQMYSLKVIKEKNVKYEVGLNDKISTPERIHKIAIEGLEIHEQDVESFYILTLNTKNNVNGIHEVSRGTLNASIVHPRDVFKLAILNNANAIILLHNHPSGDPTPSSEDITVTNRLIDCGNLMGIEVLDHIIVGDEDRFMSFKAEGHM